MMKRKILMLSSVLLFGATSVFAQGGSGHLGNGGGEDVQFKSISQQISAWMLKGMSDNKLETKLGLSNITSSQLYYRYLQAVNQLADKVVLIMTKFVFGSNLRICKNDPLIGVIPVT